jgi:uncharacterized protein YdeI (YjbR/CyaY-like superfamily)
MKEKFIVEKFDNGIHFIILNDAIVKSLNLNDNKRIICTLDDRLSIHCAIMTNKEGNNFIYIGLKHCKKLNIKEGSKISATFTIDNSKYQFEIPEELSEVLNTDEEANQKFHLLTPGNQRGLIYLISQVKSSEKKIERALRIAEKIKLGITSPKLILK